MAKSKSEFKVTYLNLSGKKVHTVIPKAYQVQELRKLRKKGVILEIH